MSLSSIGRQLSENVEPKKDTALNAASTTVTIVTVPVLLQPSPYELARQVYARASEAHGASSDMQSKADIKALLRAAFAHHGIPASIPVLADADYQVLLAHLTGGLKVTTVCKYLPSNIFLF